MTEPAEPPAPVADLVASCVRFVERSTRVTLDLSIDTLPVLDHYLRSTPPGRAEIVALVAPAAGAYFGELVRRHFDGSWTHTDEGYEEWRVELSGGQVAFNPVGAALEAIHRREVPGYSAHFSVSEADRALLHRTLERIPPVREDDFYRLAVRFEVLELLAEAFTTRPSAALLH